MTLCPARLEPIFSPRPWGALSLAPYFPEMTNLAEPIGEAWFTGNESRFANGPFAGKTLGESWPAMSAEWTGTGIERGSDFPLLVKFIFSEAKLSVQVHPDDEYAARHERAAGGRGKTEMWYAVHARPGAEVMVGLKSSVTPESFRQAIASGTAEDCLERIPLSAGEAVFVPAGTAHTIGPGLVLCEIQQNSDLTYRVYDYNRRDAEGQSRPLHIEKALDVMRFGNQLGGKVKAVHAKRGNLEETLSVFCKYFATQHWAFEAPVERHCSAEHFEIIVFLGGSGHIRWGEQREARAPKSTTSRAWEIGYSGAQVWLIPAALGKFEIVPESRTSLLQTFVPTTESS